MAKETPALPSKPQDRSAAVISKWDYAPAPESKDIVKIADRYGLFIGGKFVEPLSKQHYTTIDPAGEEPLSEIAQAGKAGVAKAVRAARDAYTGRWSTLRPSERAKYLFRIARILQERAREFAVLESRNGGKPIRESRDVDLPLAAAHFFYYAGWADKLEYAFPNRKPRPVGVAGQIIPWNFPLLMLAWKIPRALAGSGKRLTLELGGKAANIVFDDAPLDQAVEGIVNGIYFNQGHVCCAGSRLFVQESIYDTIISKLKRRMSTLRVGDPLDKNTDVGAINSKMQLDKITSLVQSGIEEGAEIYQPPCRLPERGYWFAPTVFTNVAQSYRIAQEEIFGPVLSVLTFRTPDEAVEKANNTPYGLSAGVWTEKGSRILWMAQRLRAGVIWANTYNRFDPASPFGGYKESGFGREGGLHGLEPYLSFDGAETFGG